VVSGSLTAFLVTHRPVAWIKDRVRKDACTAILIVMTVFVTLSSIALLALHSLHRARYEPVVICAIYGFSWLVLVILNRK